MYIQSVVFSNYRNLANASLSFSPGFWRVVGDNAQGKTNLLEALAALCLGRSFRTDRDREMVMLGGQWMALDGKLVREKRGEVLLGIRISDGQRLLLVNRTPVGRASRYASEAACVTFASEDVNIVLGEPGLRRDFLNQALSQVSQGYTAEFSRFRRALEQKNRALKLLQEQGGPQGVLDVWDEQIAEYGGRVCARREKYIRHLSTYAASVYGSVAGEDEPLEIIYSPSVQAPDSLEKWPDALRQGLARRRQDEVTRSMCLVGPHRDDLAILISGAPARQYSSRGQARSAALAMKLAQADHARAALDEWPVLVMDDIFTELDPRRREYLAEAVSQAEQVFASSASGADLPNVSGAGGIIRARSGVMEVQAT